MPTLQVKDATGASQTINTLNNNGQATAANSQSIVLASDQATIPVSSPNLSNNTATGSLAVLSSTLPINVGPQATVGVQITGTGTGFTLTPQASMDAGATWINVGILVAGSGATSTSVTSITANGNWEFNAAGYSVFRLLNTVVAASGTVVAYLNATPAQKFTRVASAGDQADTAATTDTGTFSIVSLIKRGLQNWTTKVPAALTTAGSFKVAIVENTLAAPVTGQVKIATTGTAVALPSNVCLNGVVIKSLSANNAALANVGSSTSAVSYVVNGTGAGFIIAPGETTSLIRCTNSNQIYVNGTVGDIFTFIGN